MPLFGRHLYVDRGQLYLQGTIAMPKAPVTKPAVPMTTLFFVQLWNSFSPCGHRQPALQSVCSIASCGFSGSSSVQTAETPKSPFFCATFFPDFATFRLNRTLWKISRYLSEG